MGAKGHYREDSRINIELIYSPYKVSPWLNQESLSAQRFTIYDRFVKIWKEASGSLVTNLYETKLEASHTQRTIDWRVRPTGRSSFATLSLRLLAAASEVNRTTNLATLYRKRN